MIGAEIYGYRVERALSEDKGGFGEVYFARHTTSGAEAVLKVLKPEMSAHHEIVTRFFNEARAAAAIQHPGIVAVHNVGYVQDRAYLLMERLRGEDLESRLRRGPLPIDQALRFLRQAAGAVGAAHERSIVHRDLKPANLFVVPDPDVVGGERIKVLDFGIAKLGTGGTMATQGVFGTPAYMAPEQCSSAADVDGRSDIYSLGCILYEMIARRPPFGHGGLELIASHLRDEPPPLRAFVPGVPPPVEALVARMLRKAREERPQTCAALVGDVAAATEAMSRPSAAHAATLNVPGPVRPSVPPPPPVRVSAPVPVPAPVWQPPPQTAPGPAVAPASTTLGSAAGTLATRPAPRRTGIFVALGGVGVASIVAIVLVATRGKDPDPPAALDGVVQKPAAPPAGSSVALAPPAPVPAAAPAAAAVPPDAAAPAAAADANDPSLDLGGDDADGGKPLEMQVVSGVYSPHAAELIGCMQRDGVLHADIEIVIDGPHGRITSARVNGKTSGPLQACMSAMLRTLQFPTTTAPRTKAEFGLDAPASPRPEKHAVASTAPAPARAPAPVAAPAPGECPDEVGCLLLEHPLPCCAKYKGKPRPSETTTAGDGGPPDELGREAVSDGVGKVRGRINACGDRSPAKGEVKISVKVSPSGDVATVSVKSTPDAALGACVASAMQTAHFPRTVKGGSFSYPFIFR